MEDWVKQIQELYFNGMTPEEFYRQEEEEREQNRSNKKIYYIPEEHNDEIYKDIVENSNYEVSNYGNVRNKNTGHNLKPITNVDGYQRVGLNEKGKQKFYPIHRLEAHAFLDETDIDGLQVNHKDGVKDNNYIGNLEWCTPKENVRHAYANGLVHNTEETSRKHREVFRRIYPPVKCIENGKVYPDAGVAAKDLNCVQSEIRKVTRGVLKSHRGLHFENVDWSEINVRD